MINIAGMQHGRSQLRFPLYNLHTSYICKACQGFNAAFGGANPLSLIFEGEGGVHILLSDVVCLNVIARTIVQCSHGNSKTFHRVRNRKDKWDLSCLAWVILIRLRLRRYGLRTSRLG